MLFGMDVIHGYETISTISLGLSCSWDIQAVEHSAAIAAREAGADGINWTFSPMVGVSRDPCWGRVSEGAGEDPFLVSEYARTIVRAIRKTDFYPVSSTLPFMVPPRPAASFSALNCEKKRVG